MKNEIDHLLIRLNKSIGKNLVLSEKVVMRPFGKSIGKN
jgi:hypothetical protein